MPDSISERFPFDRYNEDRNALSSLAQDFSDDTPDSRVKSIVLTKLEEAHMWMGKL